MLHEIFVEYSLSQTVVFEWHSHFKAGWVSVEDEHSEQPSTIKMTKKCWKYLRTNPQRLSLNNPWAHIHRWDQLRSLPGDPNRKFKHAQHCCEVCSQTLEWHINTCLELREKANENPTFISRIITGDRSWSYGYDPETKQQSSQWKSPQSPRAKKVQQVRSSTKSMLIFFDVKGIVRC
jgi:hypothetical protein